LQKLFPKVALAVGIISSTLWLPWEKYAKPQKENAVTSDDNMNTSCNNNYHLVSD